MLASRIQMLTGMIAVTCAIVFLVDCSLGVKPPRIGEIKLAIAEYIVRRVVSVYNADPDKARVEKETYLQLLIDNMEVITVASYPEKDGSWPVWARVHIPVSPASGGRGYDVFLAIMLQLHGIGDLEMYLVHKRPDGSLYARRPSDEVGKIETETVGILIPDEKAAKKQPTLGLHEAAQAGDVERTKALLDGGADINARDKDGMTPLCLAACHGRTLVSKLLLERGANVNTTCKEDHTPLHLAALNGHREIVDLLIQHRADVNAKVAGASPLWMAASKGYAPIVKALLSAGADVNAQDNAGYTPLHEAAAGGHRETVEILLAHGAQINARSANELGWTPLHFAAFKGSRETVRLLLSRGADPNAKGNDGYTPKMVARRIGHSDIVVLLETYKKKY